MLCKYTLFIQVILAVQLHCQLQLTFIVPVQTVYNGVPVLYATVVQNLIVYHHRYSYRATERTFHRYLELETFLCPLFNYFKL